MPLCSLDHRSIREIRKQSLHQAIGIHFIGSQVDARHRSYRSRWGVQVPLRCAYGTHLTTPLEKMIVSYQREVVGKLVHRRMTVRGLRRRFLGRVPGSWRERNDPTAWILEFTGEPNRRSVHTPAQFVISIWSE